MNIIRLLPLLLLTACAAAPNVPSHRVYQPHRASPEAILNDTAGSLDAPDSDAILNDGEPPSARLNRSNNLAHTPLTDYAQSLIGTPYKYGGSSPDTGFDCSGFVVHVYRETRGLNLPRSSQSLATQGQDLNRDELTAGDLVFFNTRRKKFSHVGIYLGDNTFIHAPSRGGSVRIDELSNPYWRKAYNGARHIND
ncbi:MAG: C40 family peptidase [Gallionella sp.]